MPILDTNIVIDYLKGERYAGYLLDSMESKAISAITLCELLVGCNTDAKERAMRGYVERNLRVVMLEMAAIEKAAMIRRERRLKLPDALILATAIVEKTPLYTRNSRDFISEEGVVVIPEIA